MSDTVNFDDYDIVVEILDTSLSEPKVEFHDYDITVEIYDAVIAKWVLTDYMELDSTSTSYLRNRDKIQPLLTAGKNINISDENVISAEIPPDELQNFISVDAGNEVKLGTDGLFFVGFDGLLRDEGEIETRDDLPESASNFAAYYVKSENQILFAFNKLGETEEDPPTLEWLHLNFYVDMSLYVSKAELAPQLDAKVDKAQLSVAPAASSVVLRTADGRAKVENGTEEDDAINLNQLKIHDADAKAHPSILQELSNLSAELDTKVDKVSISAVVYTNDSLGNPSYCSYSSGADAGAIAQRNSSGSVTVPAPLVDSDAVPLEYVKEQKQELNSLISKNTTDLAALGVRVGTAESNISSLTDRMTTAEGSLASQSGRIAVAEQNIETLQNSTSNNSESIVNLQTRVSATESNINDLTGRVSAVEEDVSECALKTELTAETERATAAENLKLDKASINENYLLSAEFSVDSSTGVQTLVLSLKNPVTSATSSVVRSVQLANETTDGFMAHQDKVALSTLLERVSLLEGEQRRYLYTESANPSAAQINSFAESLGFSAPFTGILIVVQATNHIWSYYEGGAGWRDNGTDTVMQATTTLLGVVLSSTENGKVYVESDGTMSVVGWDSVISNISNLQSTKVDSVTLSGGTSNGTVKLTVVTGGVSHSVDNIPVTGVQSAAFHPDSYFATAAAVNQNSEAIAGLDSRVGTAETNISNLSNRVTAAEGSISTLQSSVNSLSGDNVTNKENISNLQTRMQAVEGDVSALQSSVGGNTSSINALDERVSANEADISNLKSVKANLNSPQFTGTPTAPTPSVSDNSGKLATTNFVAGFVAANRPYGTSVPLMDGDTALVGSSAGLSRVDHVHPHDSTRVPVSRKINGHSLDADIVLTAGDILAAPTVHTSTTAGTYGGGTSALFGHVSLSDAVNSPLTADSSVAATPAAVKTVQDGLTQEVSDRESAVNSALTSAKTYTDSKVTAINLPSNWATFDSGVVSGVSAQAIGKQQLLVQFTPVADILPEDTPITVFSSILSDVLPTLKLRFGAVWNLAKVEQVGFCVFDQDGDLSINAVSTLSAGTEYTLIV